MRAEAELFFAEQPRREHRVENLRGREIVMFAQQPQIVIRGMENQLATGQRIEQRIDAEARERVNEPVAASQADLDETDLFG
jgi:hypothetical protein